MDNNPRSSGKQTDFLFDKIQGLLETIRGAIPNGSGHSLTAEQEPQNGRAQRFFTDEEKRAILEQAAEARRMAHVLQTESRMLRQLIFEERFKPYYESCPQKVVSVPSS